MSKWVVVALRCVAGVSALAAWSVARAIRLEPASYNDGGAIALVGWLIHVAAAAVVLIVFFTMRATRVASLVPLSDPSLVIERSLPGASERLERDAYRLRRRLSKVLVLSGALIAIMVIWLLAAATFLGPAARAVVTKRYPIAGIVVYIVVAAGLVLAGYGITKARGWAYAFINTIGLFISFAFPLGVCLAIYSWWAVRSLREAALVSVEPFVGSEVAAAT